MFFTLGFATAARSKSIASVASIAENRETRNLKGTKTVQMFLWERVDNATHNYHSEGGIVVIAETLQRAHEMISEKTVGKDYKGNEYPLCEALHKNADLIKNCDGPEYICIFPDAGCC